jgi:hypothetical protein
MPRLTFFCTEQDFLQRLQIAITDCGLVPFQLHQATHEVKRFERTSLSSADLVLGWQWNLWLAKVVPPLGTSELPAQAGWIQTIPPTSDKLSKRISSSGIAARIDWVEGTSDGYSRHINELLKQHYQNVRKKFLKGCVRGPVQWSHTGADRGYYTQTAIDLQNDGWQFYDLINGPIHLGTDSMLMS